MFLHQGTNALQTTKGAMALVHVADSRWLTQSAQGHDSADAQHHLLADAHVIVAAVEPGRDGAVFRCVLRDVGVQQIQRYPPDLDAPDADVDLAAREGDADGQRSPVTIQLGDERQIEEIIFRIAFLLPTIDGEVLAEITLAVHQANAHQWQTEVASAFEMIARQYTKTAGIDRDTLVNAELGGEIGDAEIAGQIAAAIA